MTEQLKNDIKECIQGLKKGKQDTADRAAAYAEGYLKQYPELAELLHAICWAGESDPEA